MQSEENIAEQMLQVQADKRKADEIEYFEVEVVKDEGKKSARDKPEVLIQADIKPGVFKLTGEDDLLSPTKLASNELKPRALNLKEEEPAIATPTVSNQGDTKKPHSSED